MPRKTLGLNLALLACTVFYGLFPLAQAAFGLFLGARTNDAVTARIWLWLVISVAFLLLMIPAWRGRPPQIRPVLSIVVLALTALQLAFVVSDLTSQPTDVLLDSGRDLSNAVNAGMLLVYVLIPLYVVWYLNRYPARRYYNGQPPLPPTNEA